jgi:uncharacterized protein
MPGVIDIVLMTWKAINLRRNNNLSQRLTIANTFWSSLRGLLGKEHLSEGDGLLLIPCQSVHTMFMRFPIDVIFLDKEGQVIHLIEKMTPWRVSRHLIKARSVLEVPAGTIARTDTHQGDFIKIVE